MRYRRRPLRGLLLGGLSSLAMITALHGPAAANPQGGTVVSGSAVIRATSPSRLDILQSSNRAVIDWRSFGIAPGEVTNFQQPSSTAFTLNRVTGPQASQLLGTMTANGRVALVNPNGILIGPNAKVDLAGLVLSTANIGNEDFMAGRLRFGEASPSNAAIVNQGEITIAESGFAAFVAPGVQNSGVINARLGKVSLAAGRTFTLDLYGDGLVKVGVDGEVLAKALGIDGRQLDALVDNSGTIKAQGGVIQLTAQAARQLADAGIRQSGRLEARSYQATAGGIILDGGAGSTVTVSGSLDASGTEPGQTGGTVKVLGDKVGLMEGAKVDVSGDTGGGTALIGGNWQGKGPERNATVTYVDAKATVSADAVTKGNGGTVVVWADDTTRAYGSLSAKGGAMGGDGGFVETSAKHLLSRGISVDLRAPKGKGGMWLLDPTDITIAGTGTTGGNGATPPLGGTFSSAAASDNILNTDLNSWLTGGATITIATSAGVGGTGNISVTAPITGAGTGSLVFNAIGTVQVDYDIRLTNGTFQSTGTAFGLASGATISTTGAGGISIQHSGALDIRGSLAAGSGSTLIEGSSIANLSGNVSGTGSLTIRPNADTVSVGLGTNAASSTFLLTDARFSRIQPGFSSIVVGRNTSTSTLTVAPQGDLTVNAPLTLNAGGSTGTIIFTGNNALDGSAGNKSITMAAGGGITLGSNTSVKTGNEAFTVAGDVVTLGGGTVGSLNVTAGGSIGQSGPLVVTGTTTLTSTGSNVNIGLDGYSNNFGTVNLQANDGNSWGAVGLRDSNGIILGGGTMTSLSLTAGGSIGQSGPLVVTGTTTLTSTGPSVTVGLTDTGNNFRTVNLQANDGNSWGAVGLLDSNGIILGGGTMSSLSLTAGGSIGQSGPLVVGTTTLTSTGSNVNIGLDGYSNSFGTVTLGTLLAANSWGAVNLKDGGNMTIASSLSAQSAKLTAAGTLTTKNNITANGGDLNLSGGQLLLEGNRTLTASGNLTLSGPSDFSGTLSLEGDAGVTTGALKPNAPAVVAVTAAGKTTSFGKITNLSSLKVTAAATTFGDDVSVERLDMPGVTLHFTSPNPTVRTNAGDMVIGGIDAPFANVSLQAPGHRIQTGSGSAVEVDVYALSVEAGQPTSLTGTISGHRGRQGARRIALIGGNRGGVLFDGYPAIYPYFGPLEMIFAMAGGLAQVDRLNTMLRLSSRGAQKSPAENAFATDIMVSPYPIQLFNHDYDLVVPTSGALSYQATPYFNSRFWDRIANQVDGRHLATPPESR